MLLSRLLLLTNMPALLKLMDGYLHFLVITYMYVICMVGHFIMARKHHYKIITRLDKNTT